MFKLMLIDEQELTRCRAEPSGAGTTDTGGKHDFLVHIMPILILDEEKDSISYI